MPNTAMKQKLLTPRQTLYRVRRRMERYDDLSLLEQHAMFMGKVQLIELKLKGLLIHKYAFTEKQLEKCTLGGAIKKLKEKGLRADLISILEELNEHRIYMAHEFLADYALLAKLGKKFTRLSEKPLRHAIFSVEQTILVYDFLTTLRRPIAERAPLGPV